MFSFSIFVSVFPFFHVRRERNVCLFGVVRVGRRHPGGGRARYPRGRTGAVAERDSTPRALTLIVRRDRKHIITVPFNHFCIRFLLHARVCRTHFVFTYARITCDKTNWSTGWCVGSVSRKNFFVPSEMRLDRIDF